MKYTAYNPATGQILWHFTDTTDTVVDTVNDQPVVIGYYPADKFYIDTTTKQPVEMPPKPVDITTQHQFNYSSKVWEIDVEATEKKVREIRNKQLEIIDKINPVWYSQMTAEQQQQVIVYRQALLDIPQQTGFPESVTWPEKPTWL
jgi:hypothetical protein